MLQHQCFVGGPEVEKFEEGFAAYCDATSCVGVANGTDALELILTGLGIGRGDEVIARQTIIATAKPRLSRSVPGPGSWMYCATRC